MSENQVWIDIEDGSITCRHGVNIPLGIVKQPQTLMCGKCRVLPNEWGGYVLVDLAEADQLCPRCCDREAASLGWSTASYGHSTEQLQEMDKQRSACACGHNVQ